MLQLKVPSTAHRMQLRRQAASAMLTLAAVALLAARHGSKRQTELETRRTCESSELLLGRLLCPRTHVSRCRLAQQPGSSGEVTDAIQHSTQEPVCRALRQ